MAPRALTFQENLRRPGAVGGDFIAFTSYAPGAVRNLLPIARPQGVVLVAVVVRRVLVPR